MRISNLMLIAVALFSGLNIVACIKTVPGTNLVQPMVDHGEKVKRGEYLVNAIGCDECHSPKRFGPQGPEIIPELRLSGFPHDAVLPSIDTGTVNKGWALFAPDLTSAVGLWGQSYAANLTPDETGTGNWTEDQFLTAIKKGKFKGLENGRDLCHPCLGLFTKPNR
ncbi:MAG: diheme cytochrome c-553 [Saprospiraceae bacterium]|nr:diheme cytochrome c-553 [Saprospiraceae bacterium]